MIRLSKYAMVSCWASQLMIAWVFGRFSSFSQSSFHFCYRKSMPWEIRCLQQFLISEDGFFVAVALLPSVRKNTIFLNFKKNNFMLVYYFAEKRYFPLTLRKLQLFSLFSKIKEKWAYWDIFGMHTGQLDLACSLWILDLSKDSEISLYQSTNFPVL